MIKKLFILFTIIILVLPFSACETAPKAYQATNILYFDTVITFTAYCNTREEFDTLAEDVFEKFEHYHKLYDIYHHYSGINNLATVNKYAGTAPVKVDSDILDLLEFCVDIYDVTSGMTNVAMGRVLSLWHQARKVAETDVSQVTLPSDEELLVASKHTDIKDLIISREDSTVFFSDPEMQLDVGSIAKGFAAERIKDELISLGVTNAILNVGGNICVIGGRYDGSAWRVGIQNPGVIDGEEYIHLLGMDSGVLVTSGAYHRYFVLDGVRYHHIVDPRTLKPEDIYESVSVICNDSALADALSTALFCLSIEDGLTLIEDMDGVYVSWCTKNGEITLSEGFSNYIIEE